jgi:alpha-glucosidase (family GH31 glycosyl hydrolase)
MGSTPEKITEKYYTLVGNPVLIPQWALGWSQCRYGYRDLAAI